MSPTNEEKQQIIEDVLKTRGWGPIVESLHESSSTRLRYMLLGAKIMQEGGLGPDTLITRVVVRLPRECKYEHLEKSVGLTLNQLGREMNAQACALLVEGVKPVPISIDEVDMAVGKDPGAMLANPLTHAHLRKCQVFRDEESRVQRDLLLTGLLAEYGERLLFTFPYLNNGVFLVTGKREDTGEFGFHLTITHKDRENDPDHVDLEFVVEWSMTVTTKPQVSRLEGF